MNTYEPKTKKELLEIMSNLFQKLHGEAQEDNERCANEVITLVGDKDVILDYAEFVCHRYNDKNEIWHCSVHCINEQDKYDFAVYHVSDDDDFCWLEDYTYNHDGPLR
jgi:hypothetical protein